MFKWQRRSPSEKSDAVLVQALRLGDGEAMAELYRRHGALVYRYVLRVGRDASIAEEVTQEVFLVLLRQAENFDAERAALSTWLCGIARRQLWKHFDRFDQVELAELDDELRGISTSGGPEEWLSRKEAVATVREGIDQLPVLLKEVIVLCELEEFTYEQASVVLAVPVGTVRSRLHRAKAKLALVLRGFSVCAEKERKIR